MNRLLYWITGRLPCRIISDDGAAYLERYYLATLFGVRLYLHRFVGSDPARGLHCHPWPWAVSLILSGWYFEETRSGERRVRWLNFLLGDSFHRVVLPTWPSGRPLPCWTLFAHRAAYVKPWGFLRSFATDISPHAMLWQPHDHMTGGDGTAHRGEWWLKAPRGIDCTGRLAADGFSQQGMTQ